MQEDNQVLFKQYEAYLMPDVECGDFISLGNEVDEDYRGIVIRKGKIFMNNK